MIDVNSSIKVALRALRVNLMRSALTMLGIIIGVAAVITMLAVGMGTRQQLSEQIASIGSNLIMILPGAISSGGAKMGTGSNWTLTMDDTEAIEKECSSVAAAAPVQNGTAQIVYGNLNWSTSVIGSGPSMLEIRDWPLQSGRSFTDQDVKTATKVALIGQTVVENLFGDADPVGQTIRIKNVPFTIVGTLASKGQSPAGQDQDDTLYVPITTAQKKLFGSPFPGSVRTIMVKARSGNELSAAEEQIRALLKQRHHIGPKQENDFDVRNLTQILETQEQQSQAMALLLGAIASISLLVGGIGIMNIMLVSVTERTREIGIRMAVGAKARDIRLQFMIEALTLSLLGGTIGIIIGTIGAKLVTVFSGNPTIISLLSILMAFGFSGLVGIFFGFYPAYKASLLNPIDALRYE
jgi:putative ABC transport system permease protein